MMRDNPRCFRILEIHQAAMNYLTFRLTEEKPVLKQVPTSHIFDIGRDSIFV